jgi:ribonuclease Z
MRDVVVGYSRAMYANWLWHRPLGLLVDAGEGVHLALGSNVFAPTHLLLTHGHSDHVLGLPGLVAARRFGKGAIEKPLTILYPAGSAAVDAVRALISAMWPGVVFPLTWQPLSPGDALALDGPRAIQAFGVEHVAGHPALGYRIAEHRRRLKPAFATLPQAEIEALARQGRRDDLTESYDHVVFAHTGDAMPVAPDVVRGADLLVHDATFMDEADRREPIHATTAEALQVAREARARTLLLYHLSVRYERPLAEVRLRSQVQNSGFAGACWWLDEDRMVQLS